MLLSLLAANALVWLLYNHSVGMCLVALALMPISWRVHRWAHQ
jgi:hypothetical protein